MSGRNILLPLGERTTNALQLVKDPNEQAISVLAVQDSYDMLLKTPHSSGSSCSSGSSINTDGSSASAVLTAISLGTSSAKSLAFGDVTAHVGQPRQIGKSGGGGGSNSSSLQTTPQSSPFKARARIPTLDDIAARLRRGDLMGGLAAVAPSMNDEQQENIMAAHTVKETKPGMYAGQRGRSEAIASLKHRTSTRSRSSSPVKRDFGERSAGQAAERSAFVPSGASSSPVKEVPSLQDIIKRISSKKGIDSVSTSPDLSSAAPTLPSTPTMAASSPDVEAISSLTSALMQQQSAQRDKVASSPAQPSKAKRAPPKLALPKPDEHPLEHTWSLFFDSKTWNPSSGEPPKSPSPAANARSWEAALKLLGQYNTVEAFMTVFRTLRRPSQLERNSNYHLFKNGIKPMWEDPANVDGGKWIITLRSGNAALLDRSWMWLVLALIGEDLDEDNDVTGAVVSTRAKGDRIAVWLRNKNDVQSVNKIGRRFATLLDLEREPGVSLEFTANTRDGDISAGPVGSFITTEFFSFHNAMPTPTQNRGKLTTSASGQMLSLCNNPAGAQHSVPSSPLQAHGTLGQHLRLHGSPGKPMANVTRSPLKSLEARRNGGRHDMSRSDSDGSLSSGFLMGVGTGIGRISSPSPVSQARTNAFGLMNRNKI